MGTIDRRREPARCGRRDRVAGDRDLAAGWLQSDCGGERPRHQSVPVSQAAYDRFKDFSPISLLASSPNVLLVRADSPFKSAAEIIAAAKAKPGSLSYGHAGNGTSTHLAGELLKNLARVDLNAIPYKGGMPAINDLLGGQIPMSFNNGPESVGQLQAGTVRALAVTTAARAPFLPDVPSLSEAVPGYDTEVWWGLLGPGGMPPDLVTKLSHDFVAALNTEVVKERLTKLGAMPIGSTPEKFDAKIRADYEKWGPIIKAAGMTAE
jgi:tripartite-type tricarboxylate transporter receptor subunit TctC